MRECECQVVGGIAQDLLGRGIALLQCGGQVPGFAAFAAAGQSSQHSIWGLPVERANARVHRPP
jgi:hypothetical protein